jgi:hypothetical protein
VTGDVLDHRRGDVGVARVCGEEHRLDAREVAVHERHRLLGVVVRSPTQPLDDGDGAQLPAEVDQEPRHLDHPDGGQVSARSTGESDAGVDVEQRRLRGVAGDADDDLVEEQRRPTDDVQVPQGDRVEGSRADGKSHPLTVVHPHLVSHD